MKTLLNIIWLVLSGIWMAIGYALAGIVAFVLVVTIPFGIASFRMANYALGPSDGRSFAVPMPGSRPRWATCSGSSCSAGGLPLGT